MQQVSLVVINRAMFVKGMLCALMVAEAESLNIISKMFLKRLKLQ
jgi:hypothetical protein